MMLALAVLQFACASSTLMLRPSYVEMLGTQEQYYSLKIKKDGLLIPFLMIINQMSLKRLLGLLNKGEEFFLIVMQMEIQLVLTGFGLEIRIYLGSQCHEALEM